MFVLLLSLIPWIGLPVITYFDLGQVADAIITNIGFLFLFYLQANENIRQLRKDYERLKSSEKKLRTWNTVLKEEVNKRTKQLEKLNEQMANNFVNLVHETKTPLTLIKSYLEEYISKHGISTELNIVKGGIDKLTADIINLFDMERFIRGMDMHIHKQVCNFSKIIDSCFPLFVHYCQKKKITCTTSIAELLFIKADSNAVVRIVNNIMENAIKFTSEGGAIKVTLARVDGFVQFSVQDTGVGIAPELHEKIFEPYYQIGHENTKCQGMGLGLPLVKKIVKGLSGTIRIESNPREQAGTKIDVSIPACDGQQTNELFFN